MQRVRLQPQGPEFVFHIEADAAPADAVVLRVHAITIERADGRGAAQRIDGLETETPVSPNRPALEFVDMNFDGFADLRIVESRPAGPNVPYLNWLFDPASNRFEASAALDALSAPSFDAAKQEVRSAWRDNAARQGSDTRGWRNGQLVPLRREERLYSAPGVYSAISSVWKEGRWQATARREGRDR